MAKHLLASHVCNFEAAYLELADEKSAKWISGEQDDGIYGKTMYAE